MMKYVARVTVTIVCLVCCAVLAKDSSQANPFGKLFGRIPPPELPTTAVKIIKQAKSRERDSTTIQVVEAAVDLNPAAAPAVVGAIARAVPEMASIAAARAAARQPMLATAIAKAAAAAAPSQAGKIAEAVCRAVPNDFRNIALAISDAAPGSGKDVMQGVAAALPALKAGISETIAKYNGSIQSLEPVLDQAVKTEASPSPAGLSRGPAIGPPYVPYSGTAQTITPNTSGEVPPGGRDYAAP